MSRLRRRLFLSISPALLQAFGRECASGISLGIPGHMVVMRTTAGSLPTPGGQAVGPVRDGPAWRVAVRRSADREVPGTEAVAVGAAVVATDCPGGGLSLLRDRGSRSRDCGIRSGGPPPGRRLGAVCLGAGDFALDGIKPLGIDSARRIFLITA